MATVEFVLKSMCVLPYVRITVRETAGRGHDVLGSGMYDKILKKFGSRQVVSSSVAGDILFIDVSPTTKSCDAFTCKHKALCIMTECLGADCPLCSGGGICKVCAVRHGCHK